MRRCGAMLVCGIGFALAAARGDEPPVDAPPLKAARSAFDIREFQGLFNDVLLVPHPRGSLPRVSLRTRTLHGQVVDHEGRPIVDAQVGLANSTDGNYGSNVLENYDKTDELGRFLLQDNDGRRGLFVRREPGLIWNATLNVEETYVHVEWPEPGRVRIVVDRRLVPPVACAFLSSLGSRNGMGAVGRRCVVLDAEGAATFDDLPPNTYRAFSRRALVMPDGEKIVHAEREFGRFTIGPGEDKEVRFDAATRIPVRGNAGPDGDYVVVSHQSTRTSDIIGGVDAEMVGDDGEFLVHVPGPGVYRVTVHAQSGAIINGEPAAVAMQRFVVDEAATAVELTLEEPVDPTVRFVHRVLDTPHPTEWPYSFSWHDGQIAELVRHEDHAGVAAELLRIAGDPYAPSNWRQSALTALEDMTETSGVIDGLLVLLDDPLNASSRTSIIDALHHADTELERIFDGVAVFADDDDWVVRSRVRSCLSRIASQHPEIKERVAPILISGLDDPVARNREAIAASLGWLKIESAATALRELLGDPREDVRLAAARAVWLVEGEREPLVTLAAELLWREDDDWEPKWDAARALEGVGDLPQETLAALTLYVGHDGKPPFLSEQDGLLQHLSDAAAAILAAHGAEVGVDTP